MPPTSNSQKYLGFRSDLRKDKDIPPRAKIEEMALVMAKREVDPNVMADRGVTALELSDAMEISKEWARRILKGMEKKGILTLQKIGQLNIYKIK